MFNGEKNLKDSDQGIEGLLIGRVIEEGETEGRRKNEQQDGWIHRGRKKSGS